MPSIMEAVLEQTFMGQQCINRFNYLASGTPATVSYSFALTFALGAQPLGPDFLAGSVMESVQDLQDTDVQYVQMTARDVNSDTDFYQVPFLNDKFGGFAGVSLSPTAAYGFRTNRTRLDIRRGQRRFVGVAEEAQVAGGVLTGSGVTISELLATRMSANLTYDDEGNTLTFQPVVVQKEKYVVPGSSPVRHAYRYYEDQAVGLTHLMTGIAWENYTTTRTQGSRQYGKGR